MDNVLNKLLELDIKKPKEQKIKIKRLSKLCGQDICFTVKELSYNRVKEIMDINESPYSDMKLAIILDGLVEPNIKDHALLEKYGVITPDELLPKMLSAGEIEDIVVAIEKLSGYRESTVEEVEDIKKK